MGTAITTIATHWRIDSQNRSASRAASADVNSPVCSFSSTLKAVWPSSSSTASASRPRAFHFSSDNQYGRAMTAKRRQTWCPPFFVAAICGRFRSAAELAQQRPAGEAQPLRQREPAERRAGGAGGEGGRLRVVDADVDDHRPALSR